MELWPLFQCFPTVFFFFFWFINLNITQAPAVVYSCKSRSKSEAQTSFRLHNQSGHVTKSWWKRSFYPLRNQYQRIFKNRNSSHTVKEPLRLALEAQKIVGDRFGFMWWSCTVFQIKSKIKITENPSFMISVVWPLRLLSSSALLVDPTFQASVIWWSWGKKTAFFCFHAA